VKECLGCGEVFEKPNPDLPYTHDTLVFIYTEPLPNRLKPEAYTKAKVAFAKGVARVKFHLECCLELQQTRPAVTGPVTLRVVPKPA
jgi:hypothetical protein